LENENKPALERKRGIARDISTAVGVQIQPPSPEKSFAENGSLSNSKKKV
jgi:hypothetical protein